jgi:hypothetical protein
MPRMTEALPEIRVMTEVVVQPRIILMLARVTAMRCEKESHS